jgi:hypothetical protein
VIDYYERGGNAQEGKSPFILKIGLTANEKQDLLAFLKSLNGSVAVATLAPHRASIEGHSSSKKSKHWQN